ncbi:hypothetical protein A3Q56_05355 [Intoshia linei]|uniref:cyclin-dependent kinase n=1 Tax=Intoshia linei TaxID=1819745 RepID=A0A177AXQ6_9BILA|nr:hypothetical protein A3Q56_05355 [Intoshia linei]
MFETIAKIGEGAYGVVFKARNKENGGVVALKRMKINVDSEGVPCSAIREVSLLKELDHINIVRLLDVVTTRTKLYMVFEFLDYDLKKYMNEMTDKYMPKDLVKSYMCQICTGISYCHTHRILHRDLKPQNLLLNTEGILKIADFGLSRVFTLPTRPYTNEVVTLWYRAPEILFGSKEYTPSVDVWSIGCLFYEMTNSTPLFPGDSEIDQLYRIFRTLGTPNEEIWPGMSELNYFEKSFPTWSNTNVHETLNVNNRFCKNSFSILMNILQYNPDERTSTICILQHPYLKNCKIIKPEKF